MGGIERKMTANIDLAETGKKVTIAIKLHGLRRFRFRLMISELLLRVAAKIAPVTMHVFKDDREPGLFYCPHCAHDTFSPYELDKRYQSIECRHCGYIFYIEVVAGEPKIL